MTATIGNAATLPKPITQTGAATTYRAITPATNSPTRAAMLACSTAARMSVDTGAGLRREDDESSTGAKMAARPNAADSKRAMRLRFTMSR